MTTEPDWVHCRHDITEIMLNMVCNPKVSSSSLSSITFCLRGQDSGVYCGVNVRKAACGQVKMCEVLNLNRCTEIMLIKFVIQKSQV